MDEDLKLELLKRLQVDATMAFGDIANHVATCASWRKNKLLDCDCNMSWLKKHMPQDIFKPKVI